MAYHFSTMERAKSTKYNFQGVEPSFGLTLAHHSWQSEKERGHQPKLTCFCAWCRSSVVRATAAKAGGPGFDSRPRIHFSMNGGLVSRQTRVQLPDSYICAKLVDFALSAVEKWYAISMKLRLSKNQFHSNTLVLVTWIYTVSVIIVPDDSHPCTCTCTCYFGILN